MKTFRAKFDHGHFIDLDTNRRILPRQGAEYVITGQDEAFGLTDRKLFRIRPKSTVEKADWVGSEYPGGFKKLADAGTELFYRVGNSRQSDGDSGLEYLFSCTLLEDLYLFKTSSGKGDSEKDWRLCECACRIDKCIDGSITLTETVAAPSLNWLFGITVMFYFNMQRSTACNAFDTFFLMPVDGRIPTMSDAKHRIGISLGHLRLALIKGQ